MEGREKSTHGNYSLGESLSLYVGLELENESENFFFFLICFLMEVNLTFLRNKSLGFLVLLLQSLRRYHLRNCLDVSSVKRFTVLLVIKVVWFFS